MLLLAIALESGITKLRGLDVQRKEGIQVAAATSGRKNILKLLCVKKEGTGFYRVINMEFRKR